MVVVVTEFDWRFLTLFGLSVHLNFHARCGLQVKCEGLDMCSFAFNLMPAENTQQV
jgi:hypothetical protein